MDLITLGFSFTRLHIALLLYDFAISHVFYVLVLAVCILAVGRSGVCSLGLYPLDAPLSASKIHPLSKT